MACWGFHSRTYDTALPFDRLQYCNFNFELTSLKAGMFQITGTNIDYMLTLKINLMFLPSSFSLDLWI